MKKALQVMLPGLTPMYKLEDRGCHPAISIDHQLIVETPKASTGQHPATVEEGMLEYCRFRTLGRPKATAVLILFFDATFD